MKTDFNALFKLSYGIYIVCAADDRKAAGFLANTVFQLTAEPVRVGVSISKLNATHDMIIKKGSFAVTAMNESADASLLAPFGYRSSRDTNKFKSVKYHLDTEQNPLIDDCAAAYIGCTVEKTVDMGTHTFFICGVNYAEDGKGKPMTYKFYRDVIKGKSSKNAPTANLLT